MLNYCEMKTKIEKEVEEQKERKNVWKSLENCKIITVFITTLNIIPYNI